MSVPHAPVPLPVAAARPPRRNWTQYLWWLIPGCAAALMAYLAFRAHADRGLPLALTFPDGHGIKPGDAVRFRGINVGLVRAVELRKDLGGVAVRAELERSAAALATGGARFWIVRPQLDWSGFRGTETLIGANYIAALPGDGPAVAEIEGLPEPPNPDIGEPGGLDVILTSHRLGSLRPGIPVKYRQLRVGSVVSVALASDGSAIEARLHLRAAYANLVRRNSRFWNASGLRFEGSFTSVKLTVDSAEALLAGGIAFATPEPPGTPVTTGHRFPLDGAAPAGLEDARPTLIVGDPLLPQGVAMPRPAKTRLTFSEGRLLGKQRVSREAWALAIAARLYAPAEAFAPPNGGLDAEFECNGKTTAPPEATPLAGGLAWIPLPAGMDALPARRLRPLGAPEDVLIVGEGAHPLQVSAARLSQVPNGWEVESAVPLDAAWHGAVAVAARDGQVLGLVAIAGKQPPRIVSLLDEPGN